MIAAMTSRMTGGIELAGLTKSFGGAMAVPGVDLHLAPGETVAVALIPFAALGVWVGHSFNVDAIGPIMGGGMALFAFLGGTWFPVVGVLKDIGSLLPSYWVVQAGHVGVGGHSWSAKGWTVIAAWTAVAVALAVRAYQADTKRA
jgi:ABC-2 type transport system permease protein